MKHWNNDNKLTFLDLFSLFTGFFLNLFWYSSFIKSMYLQQVTLLRTSRDHLTQKSTEQKDQISQLQSDLSSTNQKLQGSRLTVQRLTSDLERLRADKELVEQQMQEFSLENSSSVHTEQEWAVLQSKLKVFFMMLNILLSVGVLIIDWTQRLIHINLFLFYSLG